MTMTNFSHGITSFGVPVFGSTEDVIAGDVYFVGATAGSSWLAGVDAPECGSKERPFATIDYAIGKCTASNGDVIFVLPGHTETLAAAGAITADVAGISIIGLGNGSLRPKLTLSATASTIAISAANVTMKNLIIIPGIAEIVTVFNVTGSYCTLDGIISYPNSTYCIMTMVLTTAAADDLTIQNCHWVQTTAPAANSKFISLVGADRARILNNYFDVALTNHASSTILGGATTASLDICVKSNLFKVAGGTTIVSAVLLYTATTGVVAWNAMVGTAAATAGLNNSANCFVVENFAEKNVAKSGILDPVIT